MLINCPRCGFSQPQDKYCAQCGVDIETYRPVQPTLFQRTFGNTVFQVTILLLIAFGAAFFLYQKKNQNLLARVSYLKGNLQVSSTDKLPSLKPVEIETTEAASKLAGRPTEAKALLSAAASPPPIKGATAAVKAKIPTIRITYAEVSKSMLQNIFEASQSTSQFMSFKDYSAGIIPHLDKKILESSSVKILRKEEYDIKIGNNLQWFYGLKDRSNPEVEIGMTTFIELGEAEGGNYRGNLEIQRSWHETAAAAGIQRRSFPAIFEIGHQNGFFISGVMPHRANLENDDELASIEVYKILKSEEFQRYDSDFVIFVELSSRN